MAFLLPFIKRNAQITLHDLIDKAHQSGAVENFAIAAGLTSGAYQGMWNNDEVVYKTIEAASYVLAADYDPALASRVDSIINLVQLAQEEDGFLNSLLTMQKRGNVVPKEYIQPANHLLLYLFGHLYEAAVAHYQATGKRSLLNVALKNANYVVKQYGPSKRREVPEHEEIELALIRLFEETNDSVYLEQAKFFVHERGRAVGRALFGSFAQDHLPVEEQHEAVGQAPRATYFYSAVTDMARIEQQQSHIQAMDRLWRDVIEKKMYIHGGIGSRHDNEGFGDGYDLPNQTAYAEVCAAVSFSMWNYRMFLLHRHAKYLDVMERTLVNNLLAGVSLSGREYFYACPLASDGKFKFNAGYMHPLPSQYTDSSATRKEWFFCACCPPNYSRFIASLREKMYAVDHHTIYTNFYFANEASLSLDSGTVRISTTGNNPMDAVVKMIFTMDKPQSFRLKLRIPGGREVKWFQECYTE